MNPPQTRQPDPVVLGVTRLTLNMLRLADQDQCRHSARKKKSSGRALPRVERAASHLTGWLKLYRRMMESAVWSMTDSHFRLWITCLLMANFKDTSWFNGHAKEIIPRGSFVTSLKHLATKSRTSVKKVRQGLDNLEAIEAIRADRRAHHSTLITIVNFDLYQTTEDDEGTEKGTVRARSGHSVGTNVRSEEVGDGKKNDLVGFEDFWTVYPRKVSKAKALESWKRLRPTPEQVEQIIQAVKDQAKSPQWTKDSGQYIPHPSTWLNQRRWDDQEPTPGLGPGGPVPMDPRELRRRDQDARAAGFRDHAHYMECLRRGVGSHDGDGSAA